MSYTGPRFLSSAQVHGPPPTWEPIHLPPAVSGGLAGITLALALFLAAHIPRD